MKKNTFICLVLFMMLVINACTHVIEVPITDEIKCSSNQTIDADIALVLSPDYTKMTYDKKFTSVSDKFVIPLGENLSVNSEKVAKSVFGSVTVLEKMPHKADIAWNAVLIPTVVSVDDAIGMWVWNENSMTISTEWKMIDKNDHLIWAKTIRGTGSNKGGNAFTFQSKMAERATLMIEDLFRNVYTALIETRSLIRPPVDNSEEGI